MSSSRSYVFQFVLLFAVLAVTQALQCSECPAGNSCCMDYLDGARCYNPAQASCASTQQTGSNGQGTFRLCGRNDSACGSVCYDPRGYYCCAGKLKQNSQSCDANAATPTPATTQAPTSSPTAPAAPQYNCMAIGGNYGVNCSEGETCCGAQTMFPSCLPANGSKICCEYYLAATQCNPGQTCGGNLGPGASSGALCGPPNSTFCFIGFQLNTFCSASKPVCCGQGTSYAFCCESGATCNNTGGTCIPAPSTPAPAAPTQAATPAPTTAPAPQNNCQAAAGQPGVNCSETESCCGYGTMTPSCIPKNSTNICCEWYLSSTQCKAGQVCGGNQGYGASSQATCGPAGSTFCNKGDGINSFCTADTPNCCGYYGQISFCCAANCTCPTSGYSCVCPSS